jgi:membrane-associated protease RseP (regulator of RpoE activity)
MISFIAIDITLLVLFTLFVIIFLYTRKHNLKREGLMYLYRTQLGVKAIEYTSKKYSHLLNKIKYLVIASGFILMASIIYLLGFTLYIYLQQAKDSAIAKIPAVFPLIPYFPQLFNLESFFPPFYFTYFIVAIAIIAVSHEFAHGIFARLFNVKIKSTGFAFLGPFLGAFVEQDDKQMVKTTKIQQMTILAAGTFANVLMMILFGIILVFFFHLSYTPSGFIFNSYSISEINISDINQVNNLSANNLTFIPISVNNKTFYATQKSLSYSKDNNIDTLLVYDDSPALKAKLSGAITKLDNYKVISQADLVFALSNYKPGDKVSIKTLNNSQEVTEYNITLSEKDGKAYLGILSYPTQRKGVFGSIYNMFGKVKSPNIYYTPNFQSADFIYDLLWWIVILNILVALFNMYPAGILDGGRFLMLTVWGISGSKKAGDKALSIMSYILLALVVVMMIKWISVFF